MINFTNCPEIFNNYLGSEKKKTLLYEGKLYLVKFPDPVREKNKNISYINNAFSEYVGSHIFELSGFDTQKTILGTYIYNGKEKIVCACEDFTTDKKKLKEFELLALSVDTDKKIETELVDIMNVIDNNHLIDSQETKQKFWDMFVIDALIGNTDRHNGNWGFIVSDKDTKWAPIYDCGSCLNPMLDDDALNKLNDNEIKNLAINCHSCLKENNKKIDYLNYMGSMKNNQLNEAIIRVVPKINIDKINSLINDISCMSDIRKKFYIKVINYRYDMIKKIYDKLLEERQ